MTDRMLGKSGDRERREFFGKATNEYKSDRKTEDERHNEENI